MCTRYKAKQRIGELTLLQYTGEKYHGYLIWHCRCSCGKIVKRSANQFATMARPSCGCTTKHGRPKTYECPMLNSLFHGYKRHAKKRGYSFKLTREEFNALVRKPCFYCGEPPFQKYKNTSSPKVILRGGIDRTNSRKGYITQNVVPACKICNFAKSSRDAEDFKNWIRKVHTHLNL